MFLSQTFTDETRQNSNDNGVDDIECAYGLGMPIFLYPLIK